MKEMIVTALIAVILTGCGGSVPSDEVVATENESGEITALEMPEVDHWLVIEDSIGVELGDSNLVFGTIVGAEYLPNGNIAIGDMTKVTVNIYSPRGDYIASVGQKGQGPGEYLLLSSFAIKPDNGFIITDAMGGKINFYDSEYNFTEEMTGFFPSPPMDITPVENGFVGLKPAWEQDGEEMFSGMAVSLWTDSSEADVVYRENLVPFDFNNMGAMAQTMIIFAVDQDEDVFLAQYDTEEYLVTAYGPDGTEQWTIQEEYPMVLKPEEDIEIEREMVRNGMIARGAPEAMAESYEPDPYRSMIGMLCIDSLNRLWVMSGLYDGAVFRVYDTDTGDYLFTSALRTDEFHEDVMPVIGKYGILGFDPTTEEWPRVYMIAPEDASLFQN